MNALKEVTEKAKSVMQKYKKDFPEVNMDRDYFPLKITEEWGECMQTYLMLTDRGRQKGRNKDEIRENLAEEIADVFTYILLFADQEGVDVLQAVDNKWFEYLNHN